MFVLPERLEKFLAPEVDLNDVSNALDLCLETWLENFNSETSITYIIGPHFSYNSEILGLWAKNNDACIISSPSYEEILSGCEKFSLNFPEKGKIWVIPDLENFFLRHENGLKKIRKLLHMAELGELGKGIIGCHSFAWAYFQAVLKFSPKNVLTLQSFNDEKFVSMISKSVKSSSYTKFKFLNISNGKKITGISLENEPIDPLFTKISAYCRGNVFSALNLWKDKLRLENDNLKSKNSFLEQKEGSNETFIFVLPEITEPVFSPAFEDESVIVLHTLMIHNCLPFDILLRIIPFSESRCENAVLSLFSSGFLEKKGNEITVSVSAFYAVRKLLFGRDYLVDKF